MKKIFLFLTITIITITSCINIFAAEKSRIVDDANVLTEAQEDKLLSYINKVSEDNSFDLVIVTINTLNNKDVTAYADDYFDYNGYGYGKNFDGALFLVAVEDKEWAISTCGEGLDIYTETFLDTLEDFCISDLSSGNYYQAFETFIDFSEDQIEDYKTFPFLSRILISLIVGFVIAFIVVSVMKRQLKSVRKQIGAKVYIKPGSMNVTMSNDIFLYSNTTRRARPKNTSSGGSSHSSSSGRSHGGRSGRF